MFIAALPDWLDPELLRWMILVVIAVVLYMMYVVLRFVRRLAMKTVLFVALAGIGLSLWVQREDLQNCARICECRLYGQDVSIPFEQLPEEVRWQPETDEVGCRTEVLVET